MKRFRKPLAVLLALLMLCTLLPLSQAIADDAEPVNLLQNGDFEAGESNWTKLLDSVSVISDPTGSGQGNVMMTNESGSQVHMFQQKVEKLSAYTDYVLKFKVYTYAASGTKPGFWATLGTNAITYNTGEVTCLPMEVKTVDSSSSTRVRFTCVSTSAYGTWIDVEIPFNTNNVTSTTIIFSNYRGDAGQYYFDDIVLYSTEAPGTDLPSDAGELENGNFETGDTTGWETWQSTKVTEAAAYEGTYGVNLLGNGGWGGMLNQTVAVEKGKQYTISFWLKVNAVGVNFQIKKNDNSGAQIDGGWYKQEQYSDWTKITYQFTATSNAIYLNFCGSGKNIAEDVYMDDFKCIKSASTDISLIKNGGFETGSLSSWKNLWNNCTVSFVEGHDSAYALKLQCDQWQQVRQDGIIVEPYADYVLSAYVKEAVSFTLMIKKGDDSGNINSTAVSYTSDWTKFEVAFNSGTETSVCALLMGNNNGASALIDDVTLTKVGGGDEGRNQLMTHSGTSIRDTDLYQRGLAFRFTLNAVGARINNNYEWVPNTGTLDLFEATDDIGTLVEAGAVLTNSDTVGNSNMTIKDVDGLNTIQIPARYVNDVTATSMAFAVRVINIPKQHTDATVYARPYYTYALGNEQVTVYGDIVSSSYNDIFDAKTDMKILAIGDSSTVDAMNNHLYDIFKSAGYAEVVLGNLVTDQGTVDNHWSNVENNTKAYTFYRNNNDGVWKSTANCDALTALQAEEWDIIVLQQDAALAGVADSYDNLNGLVHWVEANKTNPSGKIYWNMAWAYEGDTTDAAFATYGKDQAAMYDAISSITQTVVMRNRNIDEILPVGTAIQSLRTSDLGDTLTTDGYHLKDSYGDYTAAMTWFVAITGKSLDLVTYLPEDVAPYHFDIARAAAHAAYTPYGVRDLSETVLLAGSDFQPTGYDTSGIRGLLGSLTREGYGLFDGFLMVGDYTPNNGHEESSKGLSVLDKVMAERVNFGRIYAQGNHDVASTEGMINYGNNDPLNATYGVYVINEDKYDAYGVGGEQAAADLTAYFNEKLASSWGNKPIFVMCHLPLHFNARTIRDKAAATAMYLVDALNAASDAGLNIIFLIGHNHGGDDDYLGGGAVYIPKGDSILVPDPANYKNAPIETEIRFTYMNAGYIAAYVDHGTGVDTTLTTSTFRIQKDGSVIITRYDKYGVHNLKSAGVTNPDDLQYTSYTVGDTRVYKSSRIVSAGVDKPYTE